MAASHERDINRHRFIKGNGNVQCLPLASILRAIGVKHVDYLSLNTEGSELAILKSLSYEDLTIDVISVEYRTTGNPEMTKKRLSDVTDFMLRTKGYRVGTVLPTLT